MFPWPRIAAQSSLGIMPCSYLLVPPERLLFPHTDFHTFHCLSPIHFPPTIFHPMELSKNEYWEGHWRNEVVTGGSTEGPGGNVSNADTLLLSWAEHKQGHEAVQESQLGFLCSSVPPCVPYQGQSRLLAPRGVLPGHKSSTTAVVPSGLHHRAWSDSKPVLGKRHPRAAELILVSRREINHWSKTGQGQSHLRTQFSENTLKIYFKYIIKGSPFNFKNTRHSINDSQFMKATTLKCYKSFTTPRY